MYSQAVWTVLSGISIVLPLLLMVFLITNCLHCHRRIIIRPNRTQDVYIQDRQNQPVIPVNRVGSSTSNTSDRLIHAFNQLKIDDLREVFEKLYSARHK